MFKLRAKICKCVKMDRIAWPNCKYELNKENSPKKHTPTESVKYKCLI